MTAKTSKQHMFTADLNWMGGEGAIVSSYAIKQTVYVTTPPEFGGPEGEWSPEHLFLSSVTSCFMSTFLVFVKKIKLEVSGFECTATGQVDVVDGKYKFTFIHLYPKAFVANVSEEDKAQLAMEKAQKYCLISNSIDAEIIYHPEILVAQPEPEVSASANNGKLRVSA